MEDAAGIARAAEVALVLALFDDGGAQPQLGPTHGGAQPGKAAADRHQVEFHRHVRHGSSPAEN